MNSVKEALIKITSIHRPMDEGKKCSVCVNENGNHRRYPCHTVKIAHKALWNDFVPAKVIISKLGFIPHVGDTVRVKPECRMTRGMGITNSTASWTAKVMRVGVIKDDPRSMKINKFLNGSFWHSTKEGDFVLVKKGKKT